MAIDYSLFAISKGTPRAIVKAQRKQARVSIDARESDKVRERSKGICEVTIAGAGRCRRRAWQVHHHKGGIGVRGRGESALAQHKSHVCNHCHSDITAKTLQHVQGQIYRKVT